MELRTRVLPECKGNAFCVHTRLERGQHHVGFVPLTAQQPEV